ncbi:WxL domain-containing protein, partial [Enterococcus hulanensis]|uniref:WxL domain-containing protein n=1 Tax=Enterococcus hulanensis TaxID=2559929 RepID=UPI0028915B4A
LGGVLVTTSLSADAATYGSQSTGSVMFKKGTLVTPPITPPVVPPVTPPASDFGLIYVPKEFNFEETAVPSSVVSGDTTIPLDANWEQDGAPHATNTGGSAGTNPTTKHFLVGDVRGTRASGWKLEAKLTAALTDSSSGKSLTGARITMSQGINSMDPSGWVATPTTASATVHTPNVVTAAVTLSTTSSTIMSAAAESAPSAADGRGEGYWQGEFTNINLVVPDTAMNLVAADEQYEGTIDWTLTDSI